MLLWILFWSCYKCIRLFIFMFLPLFEFPCLSFYLGFVAAFWGYPGIFLSCFYLLVPLFTFFAFQATAYVALQAYCIWISFGGPILVPIENTMMSILYDCYHTDSHVRYTFLNDATAYIHPLLLINI